MRQIRDLFSQVYREKTKNKIFALGIMASPRKGGNSDILLDQALKAISDQEVIVEKIILNDLKIAPCQACDSGLSQAGQCKVNDDFQKIYLKIKKADILIVSSPVYFGSISAQLKIMIDRFQCYWQAKYVLKTIQESSVNKKGAFICVQASKNREFFDNACLIVRNFFATIGVQYNQELLCAEMEEKGAVIKQADFLAKAEKLARQLVLVEDKQ